MKYLKYTRLLCMALLAMGFTACNDEDAYFEEDAQNSPIVVNKVYLQDVESSVPDREVTFARLGQVIRLSGSGLYGVRKVYINGYDTYFNRALVSDQSLLVQLNKETPVAEAEEEVRNTIRLVKDGSEFVYKDLVVRAATNLAYQQHSTTRGGKGNCLWSQPARNTQVDPSGRRGSVCRHRER